MRRWRLDTTRASRVRWPMGSRIVRRISLTLSSRRKPDCNGHRDTSREGDVGGFEDYGSPAQDLLAGPSTFDDLIALSKRTRGEGKIAYAEPFDPKNLAHAMLEVDALRYDFGDDWDS